jgi:broad specificity phosphatase PhoE
LAVGSHFKTMIRPLLLLLAISMFSSTLAFALNRAARPRHVRTRASVNPGDDVGTYSPVSMEELVKGVVDRPVTVPRPPAPFRNRYYGLRHGESEANVAGVISSDPAVGTTTHQLTKTGAVQARRAASALIETLGRDNLSAERCVFVSSDFTRARQTAVEVLAFLSWLLEHEESPVTRPGWDIVSSSALVALGSDAQHVASADLARRVDAVARLEITPRLRERYFGALDAQPLIWYNKVWPVRARAFAALPWRLWFYL